MSWIVISNTTEQLSSPAFAQTASKTTTNAKDTQGLTAADLWDADPLMRHPLENQLGDTTPIIYTRPKDAHLHITSWDLKTAVQTGLLQERKEIKQQWRNTFGAEMRASVQADTAAANLNADMVMLQNVSSIEETRRLFPARQWNVIFSSHIVTTERDGRPQRAAHMTAIAYQYARGLRVTGKNEPGFDRQQATTNAEDGRSSSMAVRFSYYGDVFWLVSTHLQNGCTLGENRPDCPNVGDIQKWRAERTQKNDRVVFGGALMPGNATSDTSTGDVSKSAAPADLQAQNDQEPDVAPSHWFSGWFTASTSDTKPKAAKTANAASARAEQSGEGGGSHAKLPSCDRLALSDPTGRTHAAVADAKIGCLATYQLPFSDTPRQAATLPRPPKND
ncbi:MAG: hypothetical protein AAFV45_04785 [Pseudomonadota bacterium]